MDFSYDYVIIIESWGPRAGWLSISLVIAVFVTLECIATRWIFFFQGLHCYDLSFSPTLSFSISVILSALLCLYLLVSASISLRLAILAPPLVAVYVCVHVCVCTRVCVRESVCDMLILAVTRHHQGGPSSQILSGYVGHPIAFLN